MMLFRVLFTYCFRGKSPEKLPFLLSSFAPSETRSQNYTRMYSFGADAPYISKGLADGAKSIDSSLNLFRRIKRRKTESDNALRFGFI